MIQTQTRNSLDQNARAITVEVDPSVIWLHVPLGTLEMTQLVKIAHRAAAANL